MSTITREQLHERAREKVKSLEFAVTQTAFADSRAELEEELELARIALASLEAKAVAWLLSGGGAKNHVSFDSGNAYADPLREVTPLYTTPPAPANAEPVAWLWSHRKHPSEVTLVRPEDDERAEGAHWSGWSCQALYAEPVTTDYKLPDGWVACSERMPDKGQNVLISVNFDSPLIEPLICSARYTGSTFRRGDVTVKPGEGVEEVTHWMPLPAAPQQEVKP